MTGSVQAAGDRDIVDFDRLSADHAAAGDSRAARGRWAMPVLIVCIISSLFLLLLAGSIALILAPGDLSHALAVLLAASVLVTEWRQRRSATPDQQGAIG
jgi:hypothetical protein